MNVIIPYKSDDLNGLELKYAIRSMVKYFTDFSGVLVIGDRPDWYLGDHIPCDDIPGRKAYSIYRKICQSPYENFLFTNDDIFATQPFDATLPNYYTGTLKDAKAHGVHLYRFENTRALIPDGLSYDIHVPMVINLTKFKEANNVDWRTEYLYRSLYGNYIGGGVQMDDCKIRNRFEMPAGPFFSTTEKRLKDINFEGMFPNKTMYEI